MTTLRFVGDLPLWLGLVLALIAAVMSWFYYRREMVQLSPLLKIVLPSLRALAFILAILILTGPVLHHRAIEGELGQVKIYVDGSSSMGLRDRSIPTDRKLAIARSLGWIVGEEEDRSAGERAEAWEKIASDFASPDEGDSPQWQAESIKQQLESLQLEVSAELRQQIDGEVLEVVEQDPGTESDAVEGWRQRVQEQLDRLVQRLSDEAELQYERRLEAGDELLQNALGRFDESNRLQRAETSLLEADRGLLDQLREFHDVEIFGLVGSKAVPLASTNPGDRAEEGFAGAMPYLSEETDLATGLAALQRVQGEAASAEGTAEVFGRQTVAILISDGQHNASSSPVEVARQLAEQGATIYAVATGGLKPAEDVAILSMDYPSRAFRNDRVRGEMVILDHGRPGLPLLVQIKSADQVVWQENFRTQGIGQRRVEFEFPLADEIDRLESANLSRVEQHVLPLELEAIVAPLPDEVETSNNSRTMSIGVVTQTHKVLLVDGRSRWETRYLRNVFERDQRWEVTTLLVGPGTDQPLLPRGDQEGQFPSSRANLFDFDLIMMGEVSPDLFQEHELQWIEEFVTTRGGGMVWLDGQRQKLRDFEATPLAALLPIVWQQQAAVTQVDRLDLSPSGGTIAALRLQNGEIENRNFWNQLPAPKSVQQVEAKPGATIWVDVVTGDDRYPAVVSHQVGAGRSLYFGFDETWRWRFKSADIWHQRFWNQIAVALMPVPFSVSDDFLAVDTGSLSYSVGDRVPIRVRLADESGQPNADAFVEALVWSEDQLVSTVQLDADAAVPGIYRAQAGPLPPGEYRVTVRASGYTQDALQASTEFVVEGDESVERSESRVNLELLGQMARESGGQLLLEEEISDLPERLKRFTSGRVVETDTPLWQSYFWFSAVLVVLSVEWLLRKRAGLL
jgi:hypothetical protein